MEAKKKNKRRKKKEKKDSKRKRKEQKKKKSWKTAEAAAGEEDVMELSEDGSFDKVEHHQLGRKCLQRHHHRLLQPIKGQVLKE